MLFWMGFHMADVIPKNWKFPSWAEPGERHPAPRPYSWAVADGIAYLYDANGKLIGFGPIDQIKALFDA